MKNFLICTKHKVFTCEHPKNNFTIDENPEITIESLAEALVDTPSMMKIKNHGTGS